ncbi:helix-turn-helix transcriptional regulator [Brachybacterium hainanense]|uniref:HTH luxR-type domain-containing protein n=1 Tax=Brachybacterium hainanense TaxID=1541174 RepID=A0ABV6RCM5_9MICO
MESTPVMVEARTIVADEEETVAATPEQGMRARMHRLRRESTPEELAAFLDAEFFAASLLAPEQLAQLLTQHAPMLEQAGGRFTLGMHLLRVDVPAPIQATSALGAALETTMHPLLKDRLGLQTLRMQQLTFDGSFDLAHRIGDELAGELIAATDRSGLTDMLPVVLVEIGIVQLLAADPDAAIGTFRNASRWAAVNGGHPAGAHADQFAELVRMLRGEDAAAHLLGEAEEPPRGVPGSRVWMWTAIPLLTRALHLLRVWDLDGVERILRLVDAPDPLADTSSLGGLWWLPVHVHARLALLRGDRERALAALRSVMQDWYSSLGRNSYAGSLLRADYTDLLQAAGAYAEAGEFLAQAETGVRIPQLIASRARLLWLTGESTGLDRLLLQVGRFHPASSAELDVLRLVRRFESGARSTARAEDRQLWESVRARAGVLELGMLPVHVRTLLAGPDELAVADPAGFTNPYVRAQGVRLSRGERELVLELQEEDSIVSLSQRLFLSPNTVKTRLRDIYRKAGVHSKEELFHVRETILRQGR